MTKRNFDWQIVFGIILIFLSIIAYFIHYLVFRDPHHIFIYLLGDVAFVFIEVLLVTLVIHRLLHYREKQTLLEKLNMIVGIFFSEVGNELVRLYVEIDKNSQAIIKDIVIDRNWSDEDFKLFKRNLQHHHFEIDAKRVDLEKLKNFLQSKREFLLVLLENPNLLEHETFTNLLWAVLHLTEELIYRKKLNNLPEPDYQHLSKDIIRIYQILIEEWLKYVEHLRRDYPYLFSLVLRTNPFDPNASIEIKSS